MTRKLNTVRLARNSTGRWAKKSTAVLAGILSALAVFATTTQTWVHVRLVQGAVQQADLNIAGSKAATAVTALALVALAGSLAISIAGRIARIVVSALILLSAAGILASGIGVLADPHGAASGPVGVATGVTGSPTNATVTVFPWLAVAAGVVLLGVAVLMLVAGRHWQQRSSKYETTAPAASTPATTENGPAQPLDDIDSWDQLSHGTDPTA